MDVELGSQKEQSPPTSEFIAKLEARWEKGNFICVGLDSDLARIPITARDRTPFAMHPTTGAILRFNREIIIATADLVCAFKPNIAFYEAQGVYGMEALQETVKFIKWNYPDIPVILDAKRADIGNTNDGYVRAAFEVLHVNAIAVHPYLGKEALKPFLDRKDKGILVLARTSNPGAGEFQDLLIGEEPLYKVVARNVAASWNGNGNCGLVVGATYPRELAQIRAVVGNLPILIPGIGAQGGEVEATVKAGRDSRGMGMIINSSRGIIFASKGADFAYAARYAAQQLRDEINQHRQVK